MTGYFYDRVRRFYSKTEDAMGPVTINIDPASRCNQRCRWCNVVKYFTGYVMSRHTMDRIFKQLTGWDVASACIAGGGEPTLNPSLSYLVDGLWSLGIKMGLITNGIVLPDNSVLGALDWIGFSVDCCDPMTYHRTKGISKFDTVIENIRKTVAFRDAQKPDLDVAFKFLITDDNHMEIEESYKLAADLGVNTFHIRPIDQKHMDMPIRVLSLFVDNLAGGPRVMKIDHRFEQREFSRCKSILTATVLPDGQVGICPDQRYRKATYLCHIEQLRDIWGSEQHHELLSRFPDDCPYCTYARMFEKITEDTPFL